MDKEVKKIIIGANQAAKDKGVSLVVIPGKYLISDAGDINALKQASQDLANLQQKYDTETKQYQRQLRQQA